MTKPVLVFDGSIPEEVLLRAILWSELAINLKRCSDTGDWNFLSSSDLSQEQTNRLLRCVAEFRLRQALDTRTEGVRRQIVEEALAEVYRKR
jgi:hypothetical protein